MSGSNTSVVSEFESPGWAPCRPIVALALLVAFGQLLGSHRIMAAEDHGLRIGLLLPPEEPQFISLREGALHAQWQAAKMGAERFEVLIRGRSGQWGADGVEAARMVTDDAVEGLIAPPDGAASHLALQVSGRTAVPIITLCADSSVGRTGVPWMLRLAPQTTEEAKALFRHIPARVQDQTNHWLAIVPDGRAGREISKDLRSAARDSGIALQNVVQFSANLTHFESMARDVVEGGADVVLVWLDPAAAGKTAAHLRTARYRGVLAGPGRLQCADFVQSAGEALEGFVIPAIKTRGDEATRWESFQTSYRDHWGHAPDVISGLSCDAAMLLGYLLAQPWFQTPPHRLASGFSWPGVTGDLRFDAEGNRILELELRQAHHGRFVLFAMSAKAP